MKHKIPGVTDELLLKAKEEFLKEGYLAASLRKIASAAGVSTNSIYSRFTDKEGLFDAIVKDTADQFLEMLSDMYKLSMTEINIDGALEKSGKYTLETVDYVYDHFDEFKLIFCKSAGTKYEHYIDKLSEEEEHAYGYYIEKLGLKGKISNLFIHVFCQSGYQYLSETVAHDLSREEAKKFMGEIVAFTDAGITAILGQ